MTTTLSPHSCPTPLLCVTLHGRNYIHIPKQNKQKWWKNIWCEQQQCFKLSPVNWIHFINRSIPTVRISLFSLLAACVITDCCNRLGFMLGAPIFLGLQTLHGQQLEKTKDTQLVTSFTVLPNNVRGWKKKYLLKERSTSFPWNKTITEQKNEPAQQELLECFFSVRVWVSVTLLQKSWRTFELISCWQTTKKYHSHGF